MPGELAGSQISALLEAVPGIASVLRSPVADALVGMIRAGAGTGEFRFEDAHELIQYAVRRGLVGADEGERLVAEVRGKGRKATSPKPGKRRPVTKPKARKARPAPRSRPRSRKKRR